MHLPSFVDAKIFAFCTGWSKKVSALIPRRSKAKTKRWTHSLQSPSSTGYRFHRAMGANSEWVPGNRRLPVVGTGAVKPVRVLLGQLVIFVSLAASGFTLSGCAAATGDHTAHDKTPPTVSIKAPADGATVSSTVTVTANAS